MQYATKLVAGQWKTQETAGSLFVVMGLGGVAHVELRLFKGTEELESIRTAARGLQVTVPRGFSRVEMRADADATVDYLISDGTVNFDWFQGSQVNVQVGEDGTAIPVTNDNGQPLLVSNSGASPLDVELTRGVLGAPLYVTPVDAPAEQIEDMEPVDAGPVRAQVVAADTNRRALRFANHGPDPVALGGAGLEWERRVIVVNPGDVYFEDRAGNMAWYAVTDAGHAASVVVQGIGV